MRLDRNINPDGIGKYALIKLREVPELPASLKENPQCTCAAVPVSAIDFGSTPTAEFFVIRLKDKYAAAALAAYAKAAWDDGEQEWAQEVQRLADAASVHGLKRRPD